MAIESVDFITALKILADKAGVKLPRFDTQINSQNKTMYNALEDAIVLYQKNLKENKTAMDYLLKRGLTEDIISEFKLGYSLDA